MSPGNSGLQEMKHKINRGIRLLGPKGARGRNGRGGGDLYPWFDLVVVCGGRRSIPASRQTMEGAFLNWSLIEQEERGLRRRHASGGAAYELAPSLGEPRPWRTWTRSAALG